MKVKYLENCLLIDDILVVGDLHLGYGGDFGMYVKEVIEKFDRVFERVNGSGDEVKKIVLLGDVKHNFGEISDIEWKDCIRFFDYLIGKVGVENVVLIKGNHDVILGVVAERRGLKLVDCWVFKGVCFLHGDVGVGGGVGSKEGGGVENVDNVEGKKVFEQCLDRCLDRQTDIKILVMGHLHPSIVLRDKYKGEKFKCFLKGKWRGKVVYVLPSFSGGGYDLSESGLGRGVRGKGKKDFFIINDKDLMKFEVIVYNEKEDKVHEFGVLGGLVT